MKIDEFLTLPPEHTITYEDGQELHKSIASNGITGLNREQSLRIMEYLDVCLLHGVVDRDLIDELEAIREEISCSAEGE